MATRIRDKNLLAGAALLEAVEEYGVLEISHQKDIHEFMYHIRSRELSARVLVKISTSPTRWQFVFSRQERTALESAGRLGHTLTALVCSRDGVCCLTNGELSTLWTAEAASAFIIVTRPAGGSYRVSGPDSTRLSRTIPASAWPEKLFDRTNEGSE